MTLKPCPKPIKKQLNKLSMEAHERELDRELVELAEKFDDWKAGKPGAGELASLVHDYDTGVLRELFNFYNQAPLHMRVAYAVVEGILREGEIPEQVWPYIEGAIEFYRFQRGDAEEDSETDAAGG